MNPRAILLLAANLVGCQVEVDDGVTAVQTGSTSTGATAQSSTSTAYDSSTAGDSGASEDSGGLPKLDVADDSDSDSDGGDIPPLMPPVPFPTTCDEALESPSSVGCEFYPLALPQSEGQYGNTAFLVSNVSTQPAHVLLEDRDGVVMEVDLAPGESQSLIVDETHQLLVASGLQRRGYRLSSDQVLQLFVVIPPERSITADASIALPRNVLGQRHRIVSYPAPGSAPSQGRQWVASVATEDDTKVTLELTGENTVTLGGGGYPPLNAAVEGQGEYTVTLDALDVLVVSASSANAETGDTENDLTGSLIHSDKPVAVYSGTLPVYVPQAPVDEGVCCADLLAEAIPPTTAYGWRYAGVKFDPIAQEPDLWRFLADRDATTITLRGDVEDVFELDAGEFVDLQTPHSFVAEGSKPFALVHFMTGAELTGPTKGTTVYTEDCGPLAALGDPAMSWVYPRGNWLTRYLFTVDISESEQWCRDRLTVVAAAENWDLITHNGDPLPPGEPLADGELLRAYLPAETGTHDLQAPEEVGFEVTAYGYASYGSYVFTGGVGVQELNPEG